MAVTRIIGFTELMGALTAILIGLADGGLTVAEAIAGLLEVGIYYYGEQTVSAIKSFINGLIATGANPVASAAIPIVTVTESAGLGTCSPKSGNRGICCAAVTQLGVARAAQGFQYTSCTGKLVCLACGTKVSTSKKHPGQAVFSVKRVSCGPSGCPALAGQVAIIPPV